MVWSKASKDIEGLTDFFEKNKKHVYIALTIVVIAVAGIIFLMNKRKANEEKALQLAAEKCKQYGIVPNESTIMLHQGRVVLDIAGETRARMDVPDLLAMFERTQGEALSCDAMLLS